jgi:hypothetical protein
MSPIAIMRFLWSSDNNCKSLALGTMTQSKTYGKHTVWNVLYKISIIVTKIREVLDGSESAVVVGQGLGPTNLLIESAIFFNLLEDSGNKHKSQKEGENYK